MARPHPAGRAFILLAAIRLASFAAPAGEESWAIVRIAGFPVGYVHETVLPSPSPEGVIVTLSDSRIILNRLGAEVGIETRTRMEEAPDGRLLRVVSEMRASRTETRTTAVIGDGVVEITTESGGSSYPRSVAYSGLLLGPEGIRRLSEGKLRAPGEAIEFQTFAPETGSVTKGSRRALAWEVIFMDGKDIPVLQVEEVLEAAGLKGTAWLNVRGESLRAEMPTPFGTAEIIRSDRAAALASIGGELPEEMFIRSILRSNVRLPRPRAIDRLRVRLSARVPPGDWLDLERPGQTILEASGSDAEIEIRRPSGPWRGERPVAESEDNREYLRPNEYIQSELPEIREAALSAVGAVREAFDAALRLERWTGQNMSFDPGIAFAPASELIRDRRGTCLGYATLLAALARASGIPSRVVIGYVYVLGAFGGHAWTEVLIDGDWIPLDAAVPARGPADAARIALASSSLAAGPASLLGGTAGRLMGQIDIRVVEFDSDGRTHRVPDGAVPFRIEGETYFNPGLGFFLEAPPGFRLEGGDAIWPDPTLLKMIGPAGERIVIEEAAVPPWRTFTSAAGDSLGRLGIPGPVKPRSIGGLAGFGAVGGSKAALLLDDPPSAWLFRAEGPEAAASLEAVLTGFRIAAEEGGQPPGLLITGRPALSEGAPGLRRTSVRRKTNPRSAPRTGVFQPS